MSFDVAPGEVFVVMGLSGRASPPSCGCLTRLIEPTAGTVEIGDEKSPRWTTRPCSTSAATQVSMVFQHFGLLPHRKVSTTSRSASRCVARARAKRTHRAQEMVDLVGLKGYENNYPDQLSGGMQQRVGLARALAADPEVLMFDEPFSALDPLIRRDMQNEVIRLQDEVGKTMVFITHDLPEALKLGDRILIMRDGEVVQVGTPDEVVGAPADEYVRDFSSEVPRSHVLTLRVGDAARAPATCLDGRADRLRRPIVADAARAVLDSDHPVRVDGRRGKMVGDRRRRGHPASGRRRGVAHRFGVGMTTLTREPEAAENPDESPPPETGQDRASRGSGSPPG